MITQILKYALLLRSFKVKNLNIISYKLILQTSFFSAVGRVRLILNVIIR